MLHDGTRFLCLKVGILELEVPFAELVGVVNQHQGRVVAQPFGLQFHRQLVLTDEFTGKNVENRLYQRHPGKDIPSRTEVDPATGLIDGSNDGAVGDPTVADPNLLDPDIGERKFDRSSNRIAIKAQEFIRPAVRTGCVRADTKSHGNGLKSLLFLVNTAPGTPPPGLVNKWTMGRVHQSDDSMVNIAWQLGR